MRVLTTKGETRLLLVNPYFPRQIMGQTPLNLAYLAAAAEQFVQVKIVDLNVQPLKKLKEVLFNYRPSHLGISVYTPNNISAFKLLAGIHEWFPSIETIVGGPHAIFRENETKQRYPWINHVVTDRKGESALVKILTDGDKSSHWNHLFPSYHLLNMRETSYQFDPYLFEGKRMIQYMASRGCNMGCGFCNSDSYTALDNKLVIDHLHRITKMGYEALFFNDVNFVSNPKRTADLMRLMIDNQIKLQWGCQTALVEEITSDLLQLMHQAGCSYLAFSVENISPFALRKLGKRIDPETVKAKAQFAKSLGMKIGAYVMFGVHEDEDSDLMWAGKTLDRMEEISPEYVSYSVLANYPPAPLPPDQEYETTEYGIEKIWDFFDEGRAYHPYCSIAHAHRLRDLILKRHASWPNIRTF